MPLFFQQHINQHTQLAIWKIEETEAFFLTKVVAQKQISNQQKRLQHLAARYLLQVIVKNFPVNEIITTPTGKPFLYNNEFYFSLSHSNNYAAAIVSTTHNVAIDIEINNDKVLKILHKFLSQSDMDKMNETIVNKAFHQLPTILWSAKETMYKWYGKGNVDFINMLKIDFNAIDNNTIKGFIKTNETSTPLTIQYKIIDAICIGFIAKK